MGTKVQLKWYDGSDWVDYDPVPADHTHEASDIVDGDFSNIDEMTISGDKVYHEGNKPSASDVGALSDSGGTLDGGTNTTLTIKSDDDGESVIELFGNNQGTGRLYVGQSDSYGGGIEYNGDNDPSYTGAGSDYITLFRVSSDDVSWTARNKHDSNDWEFRGKLFANTNDEVYHEGHKPSASEIGAADEDHSHSDYVTGDYDIQKNGSDSNGVINFKT